VWHQPNGRDQNVKFGIENKALDAILIRLCRERGDDDGDRCDLLDDFQEMHITMPLEDLHRPPQDAFGGAMHREGLDGRTVLGSESLLHPQGGD